MMCRLKNALYKLKQLPRAWFDKFSSVLIKYDFRRTMSNHSVFNRSFTGGVIVLIVYVNNIIISESDSVGIANLKTYLSCQFHTKDLGTLRYFIEI